MKKAHFGVIGAGFSGLASACLLGHVGHEVTVLEKNSAAGGRARTWASDGFSFDMGPSWYWMPDVVEDLFRQLGTSVEQHLTLQRLDPAFRMMMPEGATVDVPGNVEEIASLFESLEKGAGQSLDLFLRNAKRKYELGVKDLAFKPCLTIGEFLSVSLIKKVRGLSLLSPFDSYIGRHFKHPALRRIMEFPILFLGTLPNTTPSLYSFMNYAGLVNGTWYPSGGMGTLVQALEKIAQERGVTFRYNSPVISVVPSDTGCEVQSSQENFRFDGVIASADYRHVEQELLPEDCQVYSQNYWSSRKLAPSSVIFFLGVRKKISGLLHHNLFFDTDFDSHALNLSQGKQWPEDPLFYVCCPSKTDPTVAPEGSENLFVLVPIAAGLEDSEEARMKIFQKVMLRMESHTGEKIQQFITVNRSYSINNFKEDFNAFKGNAYGLANTIRQTAFGKPKIRHKRHKRLCFAGQLTVPGPGIPPALISGEIAARELMSQWER